MPWTCRWENTATISCNKIKTRENQNEDGLQAKIVANLRSCETIEIFQVFL